MVNLSRRLLAGASAFAGKLYPEAKAAAAAVPPLEQEDRLYRRLSALGYVKGAVASTINEYIREGRIVRKFELERCITELRKYKRHFHALEMMEWMEFRKFNYGRRDYAVRLDLIAKVKGIAAAENYFSGLSPSAKIHCTYGALLNCYCEVKMTDKALDIFAKMVRENMIATPLPYNNLMSLYMKLGQHNEVVLLAEKMKKANIKPDTFTYNLLMNCYSHLNDIEKVERVFEEMKLENEKQCNWTTYSNLANIYIKGGYQEKAKLALQNVERVMSPHNREAYHFLISLYSGISDLHNVHRIWKSLKSTLKVVTNKSYLLMLQTLDNLDDVEGLKKCYKEWESVCSSYDIRLTNSVIRAYLRRDMVEDAESVFRNTLDGSRGPLFHTCEMFMNFYLKNHQIKQALDIMRIAVSKVHDNNWHPKSDTVDRFLDCFKQESDVSSAEEFYQLMKRINRVDSHLYESLLQIYMAAGRTQLDVRARIEADGIEVNDELEHLLASVCPE